MITKHKHRDGRWFESHLDCSLLNMVLGDGGLGGRRAELVALKLPLHSGQTTGQ